MEIKLDITKHKPYKDYRGQCKFKSMTEKKMEWPRTDKKYILFNKYVLRPIKEEEIEEIVRVYREALPEVYGNYEFDSILWPDRLSKELQNEKGFMKGDIFLIVAEKLDEQKLVGSMMMKMNYENMSIYWEHGVVLPEYRGQKIFKEMCLYCDKITENTGTEYASAMAVTFHSASQKILESLGWKIRGIFPGAVAIWNHEDKYCRHSLIYFDKFYNGGEELVPRDMELTPKIASVSECLRL
jgi:RimJ/RimL family protein N-acetyltransferase